MASGGSIKKLSFSMRASAERMADSCAGSTVITKGRFAASSSGSCSTASIEIFPVASAAGTLAAIIFVLPGLVMIGWWQGFPYWTTTAITGLGGILGVMFSVPLRRTLVVDTDLPYPEGVAAAEVLRVGTGSRTGALSFIFTVVMNF